MSIHVLQIININYLSISQPITMQYYSQYLIQTIFTCLAYFHGTLYTLCVEIKNTYNIENIHI